MVDQLADKINSEFNNTIRVNTSMSASVENNSIYLSLQLTFENANISDDTIEQLCESLKGQLQTVSDNKFQQCTLTSGSTYEPGSTSTLRLQSEPLNTNLNESSEDSGVTGLTSSIILIGLLHFLINL
jgi:hypothetical protein